MSRKKPLSPTLGQTWRQKGAGAPRTVLRLLDGYVRLSVPGETHAHAYLDVPLARFGGDGPQDYELVKERRR